MINLRKTECGDSLVLTSDGQWLANGHWLIRQHLCKVLKSAPALDPDRRPDYDDWRKAGPELSEYRPARRSGLTIQGHEALTVDGKIVAWADPMYLDLLNGPGAEIYCARALEPLIVTIGSLTDSAIVAWLAPVTAPLDASDRATLAAWLEEAQS